MKLLLVFQVVLSLVLGSFQVQAAPSREVIQLQKKITLLERTVRTLKAQNAKNASLEARLRKLETARRPVATRVVAPTSTRTTATDSAAIKRIANLELKLRNLERNTRTNSNLIRSSLTRTSQQPAAASNTEIQRRLNLLENRVRNIRRTPAASAAATNVLGSGSSRIEVTSSGIIIKSSNISIESGNGLTIKSASRIKLESGSQLQVVAGGNLSMNGVATVVKGNSILSLKGGLVKINNGSKAIARHGDRVQVTPINGQGQIISPGSNTVLVP